MSVRLCAPVTDIFRRNLASLLPLIDAVSQKDPHGAAVGGKVEMLESSLNIAAPDFARRCEEEGWLAALASGRFASFSCDIGPACEVDDTSRSRNGYPRYVSRSARWTRRDYLGRAEANRAFLRRSYDGPVKAENLNYFPGGAYEIVCEPEFITELTVRADIELLLDIGHVTISARNLGASAEAYLDALPLSRVSEIHLSGSREIHGIWEDAHQIPGDEEMALVTRLLERASPRHLTLEYYGDDAALVAAYQDLWRRFVAPEHTPEVGK